MKASGMSVLQIAIDGPVAAGKSTVAQLLAERLGLLYVDTGAMYRATALGALWRSQKSNMFNQKDLDDYFRHNGLKGAKEVWEDEDLVSGMVEEMEIELERPMGSAKDGRKVTVYLEGKDVSWVIRGGEIAEGASIVSQYPVVREVLVSKQQLMAVGERVVMEGRDIGTRVLPEAPLKIYMTADVEQRVRWKYEQMRQLGQPVTLKEVRMGLLTRDQREMNRELDPLRPAQDAWILDTTDLTVEQIVERIRQRVEGVPPGRVTVKSYNA